MDGLTGGDRAIYREAQSPRLHITGNVFTSTEYPAAQSIHPHHENAHRMEWPKIIAFYCVQPAESGGATTIADSRAVEQRLSPGTRDRFARLGLRYRRAFNYGFGFSWQTVFETDRPEEVERYCAANHIGYAWDGADRLRVWYDRPAFVRHPDDDGVVWCNNAAFYHPTSIDPRQYRTMRLLLSEDRMPTNVTFGDGSAIPDTVLEELRAAYAGALHRFDWRAGDLLLLDNIRFSHGREPFTGPRKVLVTMAVPVQRDPQADLSRPAAVRARSLEA